MTIVNSLERYQLRRENDELLRRRQNSNEELSLLNNNLENIIQERTTSLELHNRALSFTQAMLENLPVAVMGVDANGMIIQCNRACHDLLSPLNREILGESCPALLPPELAALIGKEMKDGSLHRGTLEIAGKTVRMALKHFSIFDNKAYVLTFHQKEDDDVCRGGA